MVSHIHDQIAQVPCVWNPIVIDTDDQATLGKSHPYNQAASYTKLTSLKFMPEALLIEIHILFTEPQEWFGGRNMLRSKLPPLVQDGVRKFRRRLSQ